MTPGQFYNDVYMRAVEEHGYASPEAKTAWAGWVEMAGDYAVGKTRAAHTARPFGDQRPLTEIYPGGGS